MDGRVGWGGSDWQGCRALCCVLSILSIRKFCSVPSLWGGSSVRGEGRLLVWIGLVGLTWMV